MTTCTGARLPRADARTGLPAERSTTRGGRGDGGRGGGGGRGDGGRGDGDIDMRSDGEGATIKR